MIGAALFAAVLAEAALAAGTPAPMGNIVVTVEGKPARLASAWPPSAKPLGKTRGLAWAAWPVEDAVASAGPRDSALRLAYLDEREFRLETKGLTAAQVAEVMRKRAKENGQYLSDMGDQCALEAGRIGAWIGNQTALGIHREGYFTGRFIHETVEDIGDLARERGRLQSLEGELLSRPDCPPAIADGLRKRDTLAAFAKLAKAATAMGRPEMGMQRRNSDPYILYSRDLPPGLAALAQRHDLVVDKAGKGYLIPQSPSEIAKLPVSMRGIIAFLDAAESARAVRLCTPAQLDRRLAALASLGGVGVQEYLAAILDSHLRMLAILGKFLASPKAQPPAEGRAELAGLETQIRAEARQAAADALGPVDAEKARARLAELGMRLHALADFSAASDTGLAAWSRRSAAALGGAP